MKLLSRSASVFFLALVIFLVLNAPALITRYRPAKGPVGYLPSVSDNSTPLAEGLHIPRLGITAPIDYEVEATDEPRLLKQLESGTVHLLGTARPGEIGNSVVVGHSSNYPWDRGNYKTIFAPLERLMIGDYIQLQRGSQRYVYQVSAKRVVQPTDLAVLGQTTQPQLTLITCTPIGTTLRRLIVVANQLSPDPSAATPFTASPLVQAIPGPR